MSKARLVIVNVLGIVVALALIAGGAYYYNQSTNYLQTDEAKVSADMMPVVAPATGKLTGWNVQEGASVTSGAELGKVSEGQNAVSVASQMAGTVIKNQVRNDQTVQAGQILAQVADMNHLYITANIKETDVQDIKEGDSVDIKVDGEPDTVFEGKVEKMGYATNSVFALMPQQTTSGSYTKVTQKVPVKISIKNASDNVLPGMNAQIKISK
ncbi:HlyD family secretion protein [Paenibacillus xerothermodurans]|uniref:HlyD family secretion protein n=1 Tax=Paenibacillus xerothermodurans TaxID=1977292 RepID=A0A2W1N900_PAEXE|nr:HlyD family efflux transporter periplasmic adaptor subunit [Paenibacillus xerothermodurans]PZE21109.1 HlyD family secretion protein [Paenibacillus xerothermodurans]